MYQQVNYPELRINRFTGYGQLVRWHEQPDPDEIRASIKDVQKPSVHDLQMQKWIDEISAAPSQDKPAAAR
jgi:hypothetical protein